MILVEIRGADMLDARVDRVPEDEQLEQRQREREDERRRIVDDVDELLVEHCAKTAEIERASHATAVRARVSATKTSSSDGSIRSTIDTPQSARSVCKRLSSMSDETTRWRSRPKIVTSRTYGSER